MAHPEDYKQRIWGIVLSTGAVADPQLEYGTLHYINYYGSSPHVDLERTIDAIPLLRKGIDWNRSTDPGQGFEQGFTNTFDESAHLSYLTGTIVASGGEEFEFICMTEQGYGFGQLLKLVLQNPPSIDSALDSLQNRVDKQLAAYPDDMLQAIETFQFRFK